METATEWAPLELKAGEVRWMLHAPIRVAPSIRIVPSWPMADSTQLVQSESAYSDVLCQAPRARLRRSPRAPACSCLDVVRAEERTGPEDVGNQALMRGLDTALPFVRPGLSLSAVGRRSCDRPRSKLGSSPCRGPVLATAR